MALAAAPPTVTRLSPSSSSTRGAVNHQPDATTTDRNLLLRGVSTLRLAERGAALNAQLHRTVVHAREGVLTTLTTIKESQAFQAVSRPLEQAGERLVHATAMELARVEARIEARLRERFGGYDTTQTAAVKERKTLEQYNALFRLLDKANKLVPIVWR